jgi:hypothetical protein
VSDLLNKIRSRGHWRVVIRPTRFHEARIDDILALYAIVQNASVDLRGWDFPHIDVHSQAHIDVEWVGQESEWDAFLEIWRLYKSGQFIDVAGMWHDWQDQSTVARAPEGWRSGAVLAVLDTLYRFTEIFEFAARLALTDAGDELMHIEASVVGLQGRSLWMDSPKRMPMLRPRRAALDELPYRVDVLRTDLIAQPRELALKPALELFRRFGWEVTLDRLREFQAEIGR